MTCLLNKFTFMISLFVSKLTIFSFCKKDKAMTYAGTPVYMSPEICQEQPCKEKGELFDMQCYLYYL